MAISIGNVHLQTRYQDKIDFDLLRSIEDRTSTPLVLHGGSGIPPALRRKLAATHICKFNTGTEVRAAFGVAFRRVLADAPDEFDRIKILKETIAPVREVTRAVLRSMGKASQEAGHGPAPDRP